MVEKRAEEGYREGDVVQTFAQVAFAIFTRVEGVTLKDENVVALSIAWNGIRGYRVICEGEGLESEDRFDSGARGSDPPQCG